MTGSGSTVFLVDDDVLVLKALTTLVSVSGYDVRAFRSPEEFLAEHDPLIPGCAVLDVAMPGLDGLALQAALSSGGVERPVIFITGLGDVPTSVRAMKAGAVDFLTKPLDEKQLLGAIARALGRDTEARRLRTALLSASERLAKLTPREREVLAHVVMGRATKQIAYDLGTVPKTIKVHRARLMRKMAVRTMTELVRVAERLGITTA